MPSHELPMFTAVIRSQAIPSQRSICVEFEASPGNEWVVKFADNRKAATTGRLRIGRQSK